MRARLLRSLVALGLLLASPPSAQADDETARWSVGTSAWMLANALPDSPQFAYLDVERWLGRRDALVVEPVTWTYRAPIGIPYGSSYGDDAEAYRGFVRSIGAGLGWRHRLYRGLDASVRAFQFLQRYHEDGRPPTSGYQLFLQARLGWRWHVGGSDFWLEPSVAFNWWPIEVGRPDAFRARDERWPSYFLFEPWLNLGWRWRR